jgi:hypothetical protein
MKIGDAAVAPSALALQPRRLSKRSSALSPAISASSKPAA